MINLNIDVNQGDLALLSQTLSSLRARALPMALSRANRKMARYLNTHVSRQAALHTGIQVSRFRKYRVKLKLNVGNGTSQVWIGTSDIAAHHLKTPRWNRSWAGAKAGGKTFKGSFIAKSQGNTGEKVFKRTGNKASSGKDQITVERLKVDSDIQRIIRRLERQAQQRYVQLLTHEISFEISKYK